ncbi:MAG: glycosyltransferase family 4 protein [Methylococcales bacterium]
MRIGIDATCWSNSRGYGRFARDMLSALLELDQHNEYLFFMDSFTATMTDFPINAQKIVVSLSESPARAASASGRRRISDMFKMGKAVSVAKLDIFFYPSVYTYFPIWSRAKILVAIHDVIAEKYPHLVFQSKKHQLFWNLKAWIAVRQADLILTVSDFSKRGIAEHFGLDDTRIRVVSEGSNHSFGPVSSQSMLKETLSRYGLDGDSRFILYVGGIAPHKNLSVLVGAFSKLVSKSQFGDLKLVMVGDYENDVFLLDEKLKATMNHPDFTQNVIYTGYIPDQDLNSLYNAALVFVLPSFCEGFGLPALEAMACGTVVIGSNTTSVPEIVGDAGLFFDPNREEQLLACLETVIGDDRLRKELEQRSLYRAGTFSWRKSAHQTLSVLNELIA